MMKKTMLVMAMVIALAMSTMGVAFAAKPVDQHCADHNTELKIEIDDDWAGWTPVTTPDQDGEHLDVEVAVDGGEVSFAGEDLQDVEYCLKGDTGNTGPKQGLTGDTSEIENRGGMPPPSRMSSSTAPQPRRAT